MKMDKKSIRVKIDKSIETGTYVSILANFLLNLQKHMTETEFRLQNFQDFHILLSIYLSWSHNQVVSYPQKLSYYKTTSRSVGLSIKSISSIPRTIFSRIGRS